MTQRLPLLMVLTGAAALRGRLMLYPFTQPLCGNATLNYLAGMIGSYSSGDGRTEKAKLPETVLFSLPPSRFPSFLFGAT